MRSEQLTAEMRRINNMTLKDGDLIDLRAAYLPLGRGWWWSLAAPRSFWGLIVPRLAAWANYREFFIDKPALHFSEPPKLKEWRAGGPNGVEIHREAVPGTSIALYKDNPLYLPPQDEFLRVETRRIPAPEGCGVRGRLPQEECVDEWVPEDRYLDRLRELTGREDAWKSMAGPTSLRSSDRIPEDSFSSQEELKKWRDKIRFLIQQAEAARTSVEPSSNTTVAGEEGRVSTQSPLRMGELE